MERIENKNAELTAEFEKAKELGIVGKDPIGNWDIQTTEDLDVEAIVNGITGNKDITAMTAAEHFRSNRSAEEKDRRTAGSDKTNADPDTEVGTGQ